MRWANPLWIAAALPALAAVAYAWRQESTRRAALVYPGSTETLRAAAAGAWARELPLLLRALVLVLCVLALARPQKILRQMAGLARGIDIMLVIDTSTSMRALDFNPLDRMGAAKAAAKHFISRRVSDRIGILVFGGDPALSCPRTLDYEALYEFIDGIYPGMTQSEGTAIGDGLAAAVNHLKESAAKSKVAILLTDGRNNAGLIDPFTAARAAKSMGIKVYTIATGKHGDALYPIDHPVLGRTLVKLPEDIDEEMLEKVAQEADGRYFRATNVQELSQIYEEIDRLEKTEVKLPETLSFQDLHARLLLPAAALFALELLLSSTWLLRIP